MVSSAWRLLLEDFLCIWSPIYSYRQGYQHTILGLEHKRPGDHKSLDHCILWGAQSPQAQDMSDSDFQGDCHLDQGSEANPSQRGRLNRTNWQSPLQVWNKLVVRRRQHSQRDEPEGLKSPRQSRGPAHHGCAWDLGLQWAWERERGRLWPFGSYLCSVPCSVGLLLTGGDETKGCHCWEH